MGNTKKALNRKQPNKKHVPTKSVITKGTNTLYPANKGAKSTRHAVRRELWNKKIEKAISEKDRRKKGQVKGGVFNPEDLMLSLPQIARVEESVVVSKKQGNKKGTTRQNINKHLPNPHKSRNRTQLLAEEAKQFSRVLQHPAFKQDASQAIHQHIVNKIKREQS